MVWPTEYGPPVSRVLSTITSAEGMALPPLPVLSVLLPGTGSASVALALAELLNGPGAEMVAVTVMVASAPAARLAIRHGRAAQPPPLTVTMARFVGTSVTLTFVAVDGPALATKSV